MGVTNFPNGIAVSGVTLALPNYLAVTADLTSATWNTVASHELFTVTGLVRVQIVAQVTVAGAGATATIQLGVEGSTNGIIAATTITDFVADELWYDATPTTKFDTLANAMKDYIVNGLDIGFEIATAAATAGTIVFHCFWEAISSGATVVAGAGGTL